MQQDTIVALATPPGSGAIAVIRISGENAHQVAAQIFLPLGKDPEELSGDYLPFFGLKPNSVTLGHIYDGEKVIDQVLLTRFDKPRSYTGEDVVEISCHGSIFIQQEIIKLCNQHGARMAEPGEFTLQAFLNAKMDLVQAEAVADLIASESATAHQMAIQQMRGGFTDELKELRAQLVHYASMIELELDFSEEDVEFAQRDELRKLLDQLKERLRTLIDSFAMGNVLKTGIPVAIIGQPNVGKSTLLNALLNEERAIVSDIAGTTRDSIEDEINIEGVRFRFIDTAGIRQTSDTVESIGIERTYQKIDQSRLALLLFDASQTPLSAVKEQIATISARFPEKPIIAVMNKMDEVSLSRKREIEQASKDYDKDLGLIIHISAKNRDNIDQLKKSLLNLFDTGLLSGDDTVVSNARHFAALKTAQAALLEVQEGLQNDVSSEFLAIDLKRVSEALGLITGEITNDELLGHIFSNFCIGK